MPDGAWRCHLPFVCQIHEMTGRQLTIAVSHAAVGWALCGATMGVGLSFASERTALVLHAVAAPIFFALISGFYFKRFHYTSPLQTAVLFVSVVILLDLIIVAGLIQKSLDMFQSFVGTWLVFALIFASTWLTGMLRRRREATRG